MNERIKELILKAGWQNAYFDPKEGFELVFENEEHNLECVRKFAELIIKKCVMIGNYAHDGGEYPGPMIKEYFGVEEQEKVVSKPRCSVCGTTENVKYVGGHQPYLCDSEDCIPY